jgi:hypothetical protein
MFIRITWLIHAANEVPALPLRIFKTDSLLRGIIYRNWGF